MALSATTVYLLKVALGGSDAAVNELVEYIDFLQLVDQQIDPNATTDSGSVQAPPIILGIPGSSRSVERVDVDVVPTGSTTNKTAIGTSISSSVTGSYNVGTAAGGAADTDFGGAHNLDLSISNLGSGQRAQLYNLKATSTNAGTGAVGLMENANFEVSTSSGSSTTTVRALHALADINSGSSVTNMIGIESSADLDGTVTNYLGIFMDPTGAATNAVGVFIDMSDVTSTSRKIGLQVDSAAVYLYGEYSTASSLGLDVFNSIGNNISTPTNITGTDIVNSLIAPTLVATNNVVASGPAGLGMVGAILSPQAIVSSGKTVDMLSGTINGMRIGTGNLGTITEVNCNLVGIDRSLSTGGTITNAYGFRVKNTGSLKLSGAPVTNAWGISIEDTGAKNYFAGQVQLGSGSVSAPALAFANAYQYLGLYSRVFNEMSMAIGGTEMMRYAAGDAAQGLLSFPAASTGQPNIRFGSASTAPSIGLDNTTDRMVLKAVNKIGLNTNSGAQYCELSSAGIGTNIQYNFDGDNSPTQTADRVSLGGKDIAAGRRSLVIATEENVATEVIGASTHTLSVTINGTVYKILLST